MKSAAAPVFSHDSPAASPCLSPWVRFNWKTASRGATPEGGNLIRKAAREEGEEVLKVLQLSLSMDSSWNDAYTKVEQFLQEEVARLFNNSDPLCLVIPKGNRIIAASLMDPEAREATNLVSGPAVLIEYRNRGIGSCLLQASLSALAEAGVSTASSITLRKSVAARHVYSKFGGKEESALWPKCSMAQVGAANS